ncbi:hypothetical protein Tco_1370514 [Tanacetum coccineum]
MNPVATQQVALDNSLVAPKKRLKIKKCNARIAFSKPQREETYQVTLDALKLTPCYPAFLVTAEVPEVYMHQFWNTIHKIKDTDAYRFKLDKKKFRVDTKVFREILQICPRLPNQAFVVPPSEEELVKFIQELGYSGKCDMLSAIHTDQMHQPWRTFAAIINRCISGKTTGLDRLRESQAQILWGMYNKKNVDYVALLWEDFMYQADNREISSARKEHMPYPRFTKVIINHFISKDKTISMRNMINLHTIRDDSLLGTLKFVSKTQDYQQYGALIPDDMINQDIKDSKAYKTYDFATGKATPKKARKIAKKSTTVPTAGVAFRDTPLESVPNKKTLAKVDRGKGIDLFFDAALLEAAQVKEALQKSKKDSHMLHASGSDEGTGAKPGVPNVPKYLSESKNESWGDSGDDGSNDDDSDEVTKDDDEDDNDDEEEEHPDSFEFNDDEEEYDELYKDVDVNSLDAERKKERKGDTEMTDADKNVSQERSYEQVVDDAHVTLTTTQKTEEFEKKAQVEKEKYIVIIEKSVKEIIKDEVKSQLPQISPKEISDLATPVIQSTINESLENVVLAKSSSQSQLTYDAATSLAKDLYDALVKSYQLNKDLFDSYGKAYSLKRGREDKDKDEDPLAGPDQGLKKRKTSKDVEPSRVSKSKESKSSSSKGSKSQSKSYGKSDQAEEPVFNTVDPELPQDQEDDFGNTKDQPNVKEASKHDWFKKPERPPTPDRD